MEKIEIGNTKGKTLTDTLKQINEEFKGTISDFVKVNYDIMDIEKRQFEDDFYKFR